MRVKSGEAVQPVDGRRERWSTHRAARREEFVDAALRALAAHGPELRVERVAAEAGVSKPVLYRHFTDKAHLLAALHDRVTVMLMERLEPALDPTAAPRAQIRGAVDAFFSLLEDHPNLYWLVSRSDPAGPASEGQGVRASKEMAAKTLAQIFDEYLHAYGLDTRGAEPLAHSIVGMVHSTADWWMQKPTLSRADVVAHLSDSVWDCLDGYLRRRGVELPPDTPLSPDDVLVARTETTAGP
ncbi:TetR/AcrR family transcriptional regulator [Streptomyces sp. JJ38]|uniref:TetR/AcrR family transcriptional regulator n=1 Tax=Streptomyces sp. JJ38 TaxID=2738128 RepID=UPI001C56762A|nr:TetR/AcrR family transcriptional regulator [Streptomyces sp. JJ38]MBW1598853.1 TetR/AcrR family transcriptional regulator [Streptomyces sp. JJ38]